MAKNDPEPPQPSKPPKPRETVHRSGKARKSVAYRSAKTGRFVTKGYAKKHPKTTIAEGRTLRPKGSEEEVTELIEQLAYDESRLALDKQLNTVDTLRTRAGTLLAVASIVTTFLGGQALEGSRTPNVFGYVAIGAFIALGIATVVVLLPSKLHLSLDAAQLVTDYVDEKPQPARATVLRDLALHHHRSVSNNDEAVARLANTSEEPLHSSGSRSEHGYYNWRKESHAERST